MSIRSPHGANSESSFDESLVESSFYFNPSVDIPKWSQGVPVPAISGEDIFFSSEDLQDMSGSDAFELKNDTASVYSMTDSAYQSQTGANRRANSMPEGFQTFSPQDTRSHGSSQFPGSDIYSPTLSSDAFPFQEHHTDMGSMRLPSAAGEAESAENPFSYANFPTPQGFNQYTSTVPRYTPSSEMAMGFNWSTADAQPFNAPFNFTTYSNDLVFGNQPVMQQRQAQRPQVDTAVVRPSTVRSASSFTQQSERRASASDPSFGNFMMSPASTVNVSLHRNVSQNDFTEQQQLIEARAEKEETASTSLAPQSLEDEEPLSPSDAAEAQTMEDEQGKVARSHHLYQAQPDENGEYHCPNEGKQGCTHKPTKLKCNYDKYVDSHLRPFRCRNNGCVGVQFSSTACLLRHEREAHGMHGHGSKPHLCRFSDCERSVQGNGFPRRYNLFDHMKRVHDWTGPAEQAASGQQSQTGAKRAGTSRKRRSTADEHTERRQKVAKPTAQQQLQQRRGQLQQDFQRKKDALIQILQKLSGPHDLQEDIDLSKEVVRLHEISSQYKGLG